MGNDIKQSMSAKATLKSKRGLTEEVGFNNIYRLECKDKDGNVKWVEENHNLVTTEGLNYVLGTAFFGNAGDSTWFVGLTEASPVPAVGDTLSNPGGHSWTELVSTGITRQAVVFGALGATDTTIDNSASVAEFVFSETESVGGAFICTVASGTSGILYGVSAFAGGNRPVANGDTINVTVTISLSNP